MGIINMLMTLSYFWHPHRAVKAQDVYCNQITPLL